MLRGVIVQKKFPGKLIVEGVLAAGRVLRAIYFHLEIFFGDLVGTIMVFIGITPLNK